MKLLDCLFYAVVSIMVLIVILNNIKYTNYYSVITVDEVIYKNTIDKWQAEGTEGLREAYQGAENKPVSFLFIQGVLDATPVKTRALNLILVVINTFLIYRFTGRIESFVYPVIPFFLNSMWLTVEIIETFFIILAISYQKYQGLFIGLATIFRPYALLYSNQIRKRQLLYVAGIVGLFMFVLFQMGILFSYFSRLFNYGSITITEIGISDPIALSLLFVFMLLGSNNKELFKYGLVASIPLIFRTFGHYFIPSYSLFFISYLKQSKI